jgi:hypothetical protein
MANTYLNVNFHDHGRTELSGTADQQGFIRSLLTSLHPWRGRL